MLGLNSVEKPTCFVTVCFCVCVCASRYLTIFLSQSCCHKNDNNSRPQALLLCAGNGFVLFDCIFVLVPISALLRKLALNGFRSASSHDLSPWSMPNLRGKRDKKHWEAHLRWNIQALPSTWLRVCKLDKAKVTSPFAFLACFQCLWLSKKEIAWLPQPKGESSNRSGGLCDSEPVKASMMCLGTRPTNPNKVPSEVNAPIILWIWWATQNQPCWKNPCVKTKGQAIYTEPQNPSSLDVRTTFVTSTRQHESCSIRTQNQC